jgi:hypothetical protein
MRVKATQMIYYGNRRIHPGQVFTLLPMTVNYDKDGKKLAKPEVISAEKQFTEGCMQKVSNREVYNHSVKKKKGSHEVTLPNLVTDEELENGIEDVDHDAIDSIAPGADALNPAERSSTGDQDVI